VIAVIGLGNIGLAIAGRLAERGQEVCGVEVSPERRADWKALTGLDAVADLTDVPWAQVTHVFVIVRLTGQAEQVLSRLDELPVPAGTGVILNTTLELRFARGLERYADRAWRLIELPVSGGESGARAGTLTVLAAGKVTDTDRELLLATMAATVVDFDRYGEPTLAKLLNNLSAAYTALSYAEVMLLAKQSGMDTRRLADILRTSSGGSWMGDHFAVITDDVLAKDVELVRDQLGEPPLVSLAPDTDLVARLSQARALLVD
jgi:3-hydroxyisobutyrate dehydrogenase